MMDANAEKKIIENFLEHRTFICSVFNARMSVEQCTYQCARSEQQISDYIADYFLEEESEVPTKFNECLKCPKHRRTSKSTARKLKARGKRYKNTPGGWARMRVESHLESRGNRSARWIGRKRNDS